MKNWTILLSFMMLSLGAQARSVVKVVEVGAPAEVVKAAADIYEMGRGDGDAGGISSVQLFDGSGFTDEQILEQVMFGFKDSVANNIAVTACADLKQKECVKKVIAGDEEVRANHQFDDIFAFIAEMYGWNVRDAKLWEKSLATIEAYTTPAIGVDHSVYSFGFDDVADVFTIIYISKDKKTVLLFTGDYGA